MSAWKGPRAGRLPGLMVMALLLSAAACTGLEVTDDLRTDYVPRYGAADQVYEVTVEVVDLLGEPVDDVHVRLRGVRHLNGFHDAPETEFYLFGRSGDGGAPGMLSFRFPAPADPAAFDLYVVTTDARRVVDSHYYPGRYWTLKWLHNDDGLEPIPVPSATFRVQVEG